MAKRPSRRRNSPPATAAQRRAEGLPPRRPRPRPRAAAGGGAAARRRRQAGESQISRVDAQGHVVVTTRSNTGRGDFGVYNGDTGIATLIGNVVIQRGENVIQGQRGVMDLNNNITRMMPGSGPGAAKQRVQGLFVRDQAKPGAAPAGDASTRDARPPGSRHTGDRRRIGDRIGDPARRISRAMPVRIGCRRGRVWWPTIAAASRGRTAVWSGAVSARASSAARCCAMSASRCSAARWSVCSARTAPARRPASTSSPG